MEFEPKDISYDSTDLRSDGVRNGDGVGDDDGDTAGSVKAEGGVGDGVGDGATSRPKLGLTTVIAMAWCRGR
jgi:hypothetical protein